MPQFDKAKVVVALDHDFLNLDAPAPFFTTAFSKRRQRGIGRRSRQDEPAVCGGEPVLAHRRERGSPAAHEGLGRAAVRGRSGCGAGRDAGFERGRNAGGDKRAKFLAAVVKDLKAAGAEALVVAGPRQPASVHALAALINEKLGSGCVTYTKPVIDKTNSGVDALKALAGEMSAGQVSTLVMLGGNPVYSAPADLQFGVALSKVANFDSSGRGRRRDRGGCDLAHSAGAHPRIVGRRGDFRRSGCDSAADDRADVWRQDGRWRLCRG